MSKTGTNVRRNVARDTRLFVSFDVKRVVTHDQEMLVSFDVQRRVTVETDAPASVSLDVTEDGIVVTQESVTVIQSF